MASNASPGYPQQNGPSDAQLQWQGYSVASWEGAPMGRNAKVPGRAGHLRVVTTQMKPGYLRKNGVPYSEKATLEEYFDTLTEPDNTSWLVVTSIVTDPQYLTDPKPTPLISKASGRAGLGSDALPSRLGQTKSAEAESAALQDAA